MTDRVRDLGRLHGVLALISTPIKRENFSLSVDPNQVTNGLLSEFYTGTSLNKDSGEVTHIAIKIVPSNGIVQNYSEVYKNEIDFYSTIFPELDHFQKKKRVKEPFSNIPRYLCGYLIPDNEFLMLEYLKPAGYELFDKTKYLKSSYLELVFKTYAKFHALSFVYKHEQPEKFDNLTRELIDIMKYLNMKDIGKSIESAYLAAIEAFDSERENHIIERLRKVENVRNILANARQFAGEYTCLIHGDCWIYNMLFKQKPSGELEDVKLIDFQLAFVSTPVYDLSYIFYSGAAKADMDKLNYYLEIYYDSFSSFVNELGEDPQQIYPFETLKEDWKKYALVGVIIGIGMWVGKLTDRNEVISFIDRQGWSKEKFFEIWNAKMSEVRSGNPFRQKARDICLHAVEYGII